MSSRIQKAQQLLQIPVKEKIEHPPQTLKQRYQKKKTKKQKEKQLHRSSSPKPANESTLTPEQTEITTKLLNIIQRNIRDAEYYESSEYIYFTINLDNVSIKIICGKGRLLRDESDFLDVITVYQYTRRLIRKKVKNKLHWKRDIEGRMFNNFWSGISIVIAARYKQRQREQQQLEEQKQKTKLQNIINNLKE